MRIAYFAHSLRSDWNNGNAHFLRGLMRGLIYLGHDVVVYEPRKDWSIENLQNEESGPSALQHFSEVYPDLKIDLYETSSIPDQNYWENNLRGVDIVVLHEWNPPALAHTLLQVRNTLHYKLLFHDTHHRASSSPDQIQLFGTDRFDGVLAFGEVLRTIYREHFGIMRVWILHEAADTTVFKPLPNTPKKQDVVWIGNWGDDERSEEIREFLLTPASQLRDCRFTIYGVRYPEQGLGALKSADVVYGGYLPNLDAPSTYASSRLTVHIPRRQYATQMIGIPTIRVFEALACGIPLISAPWKDTEHLFRPGDFLTVHDSKEMKNAIRRLLSHPEEAEAQALRGLETILARHTCLHRAEQLSSICEEVLR
ncbi:MAG: glycosyltransferase [Acidobacteria bacterium]|nr:glycosyltransferase [Acidobacteriota bacterium]